MGFRFGFFDRMPVSFMDGNIIDNRRAGRKHDFLGASDGAFYERHTKTLLLCLFLVHFAATLFFFSPGDILNDKPVVTLDHSFHYYQAWRAKHVLLETGRLNAYDPYFMAGFPSAIFDLDVKGSELFCALFPAGQLARGLKFFILVCYLSMVFTVFGGARLLGFDRRESLLGVGALLIFWHWGRPYASHFRYAGMFEFIFVSHFSILVVGLFRRFLRTGERLWFFVLGPVAFLIHPTAVVALAVPFVMLFVMERKRLTSKKALGFLLWCGVVIVVNLIWVLPMLANMTAKASSKEFFQTGGARDFVCEFFHPGCFPALVFLALAVLGAWRVRRSTGAAVMIPSVLFLFGISSYGVYLPGIEHLEPGRFLLTTLFFAAPLAGAGAALALDGVGRLVARAAKPGRLTVHAEQVRVASAGPPERRSEASTRGVADDRTRTGPSSMRSIFERAVFAVLFIAPIVLSFLSARTGYQHRITTSFAPEVQTLIDVLVNQTDSSGRLMIEDGPAALYGESHMPGILPIYTGVEQIGGPYPFTFLKHHFATFQKDKTFGKPLEEISPALFWRYIDLYNVRWIVTASPATRAYITRASEAAGAAPAGWETGGRGAAEIAWASPHYRLWRVNRPTVDVGAIVADFNQIQIAVGPGDEAFLLPYHWDSGMRVPLPTILTPVHRLGDPVPFTLVEPNGVSLILIKR